MSKDLPTETISFPVQISLHTKIYRFTIPIEYIKSGKIDPNYWYDVTMMCEELNEPIKFPATVSLHVETYRITIPIEQVRSKNINLNWWFDVSLKPLKKIETK